MKLYLIIVLLLAFASLSFGQTPSASSTPQSDSSGKTRTFGSSLKKYKNNGQRYFQANKKSIESDDGEAIRVKTDLVVTDVLVTDKNGKMITDLTKDDFIVTEDDAPQKIEMFSAGGNASVPRSIVLIIDCAAPQAAYLRNSIEAAKILVDNLAPQDKMAIVTSDMKLLTNFTQDKTLLKKILDSLEKKVVKLGGGLEFDALLAVLNEMFDAEDSRRIVVFQVDGHEILWLKPDKDAPYPISDSIRDESGMKWVGKKAAMRDFGFNDIKEAIERSRVTIYSIVSGIRFFGFSKKERMARAKISLTNLNRAFGFSRNDQIERVIREFQDVEAERQTAGQTAMLKVAELSGGYTGFIEKPEDAENVYSSIFTLISNRYFIGYYPTNQEQDGKLREVKIEVREHPEYIVTGRKAYFPQ